MSDGWLPFKARYFADNPDLALRATLLNKDVDTGRARYDDFIREMANMANLDESVARQQIENNIPDEKLFVYIRALKQKYKIGLLSNAGANWLNEIFLPDQVALFDVVALSCDMGVAKPDPQAYEIIAEKLGLPTKECVFVDDQPKYVDGAKAAGMRALLYSDVGQLQRELEALLADA